jgi:hypothetical protein
MEGAYCDRRRRERANTYAALPGMRLDLGNPADVRG